VSTLVDAGRVEETAYFSPVEHACLSYALVRDSTATSPQIRYAERNLAVVLPGDLATAWANSDQVGIYAAIDLGPRGTLDLVVEKDFACLDVSDADNLDTYPNPKANN
jgi:hypothetical protein